MIQRIQTVYLFLAAITTSLVLFLPLYGFEVEGTAYALDLYNIDSPAGESPSNSNLGLLILVPLTVVAILFVIFSFANRKRQAALGNLLYLMLAGVITLLMFFIEANKPAELSTMGPALGYFGPIAALPFVFLANRSIKKDEDLIKSLDRLR